jgi:hypothetical protein
MMGAFLTPEICHSPKPQCSLPPPAQAVKRMAHKSGRNLFVEAPSTEAEGHHQYHHHQDPTSSLSVHKTCGHRFARKFGIGVSQYMKMLKFYTFVYLGMAVLNIPALVAFLSGTRNVSDGDEVTGAGLEAFTLANVPQTNG